MRVLGLQGVSCRQGIMVTTRRNPHDRPVLDLVQRKFVADGINQLWVADMTYIPSWQGFLYLAVVADDLQSQGGELGLWLQDDGGLGDCGAETPDAPSGSSTTVTKEASTPAWPLMRVRRPWAR